MMDNDAEGRGAGDGGGARAGPPVSVLLVHSRLVRGGLRSEDDLCRSLGSSVYGRQVAG